MDRPTFNPQEPRDALRLIAQGWEVIESDGSQMTIQAPRCWEDDHGTGTDREFVIDTDDGPSRDFAEGGTSPPESNAGDGASFASTMASSGLTNTSKGPTVTQDQQDVIERLESVLDGVQTMSLPHGGVAFVLPISGPGSYQHIEETGEQAASLIRQQAERIEELTVSQSQPGTASKQPPEGQHSGGWRDIASAPRDGSMILGALWDEDDGEWCQAVIESPTFFPFTHWMPLPPPPENNASGSPFEAKTGDSGMSEKALSERLQVMEEALKEIVAVGTRSETVRVGDAWAEDGWADNEIVSPEAEIARAALTQQEGKS